MSGVAPCPARPTASAAARRMVASVFVRPRESTRSASLLLPVMRERRRGCDADTSFGGISQKFGEAGLSGLCPTAELLKILRSLRARCGVRRCESCTARDFIFTDGTQSNYVRGIYRYCHDCSRHRHIGANTLHADDARKVHAIECQIEARGGVIGAC